jgi:hypothetical protein
MLLICVVQSSIAFPYINVTLEASLMMVGFLPTLMMANFFALCASSSLTLSFLRTHGAIPTVHPLFLDLPLQ